MPFDFSEFVGMGKQPEEKQNNAMVDALGQSLTSKEDKGLFNSLVGSATAPTPVEPQKSNSANSMTDNILNQAQSEAQQQDQMLATAALGPIGMLLA